VIIAGNRERFFFRLVKKPTFSPKNQKEGCLSLKTLNQALFSLSLIFSPLDKEKSLYIFHNRELATGGG